MAINGRPRKIDYDNWSKPELIREIKKLEKRKKYGIVWDEERTKEIFEEEVQHKLPVLTEIKSNQIKSKENQPFNILIEGDNYHAISVLNYTHKGKIDMIYIDPPYNTGSGESFRYNDKIVNDEDSYKHSKWLSFMNKRLQLARKLLKKTGVIFVSIDDFEIHNLKSIMNEIFGEENFVDTIIWKKRYGGGAKEKHLVTVHEYILFYAKNKDLLKEIFVSLEDGQIERYYKLKDSNFKTRGPYRTHPLEAQKSVGYRKNLVFPILAPDKTEIMPEFQWRWDRTRVAKALKNNELEFLKNKQGIWSVHTKQYLNDEYGEQRKSKVFSIIDKVYTQHGTEEIKEIFGDSQVFPFPKPTGLILELLKIANLPEKSIILDFFAGSGTTGHAVLTLNKTENKNRQFILCTNNEGKICTDVCYPRIKKVINGYQVEEMAVNGLGGNLKYLKTEFVSWELTDKNKRELVQRSTEMLCLKENCFDLIKEDEQFKIFKNHEDKYLGIIYYYDGIEPFKKEVVKLNKKINTYVFSLSDIVDEEEFQEVDQLVNLKPIPYSILNVYRRIFAYVQTKKIPREVHSGTNG